VKPAKTAGQWRQGQQRAGQLLSPKFKPVEKFYFREFSSKNTKFAAGNLSFWGEFKKKVIFGVLQFPLSQICNVCRQLSTASPFL